MSQVSSDPTITMIGGGYYSANALGAKTVIDATKPWVNRALRALASVRSDMPFAIADFGASDGGTSLELMRHIVRTVRGTFPQRAITLTYTDMPYNDFSTLFRRIHGSLGVAAAPADAHGTVAIAGVIARPSSPRRPICEMFRTFCVIFPLFPRSRPAGVVMTGMAGRASAHGSGRVLSGNSPKIGPTSDYQHHRGYVPWPSHS
jgi:hypothetical protein